MLVLLLRWESPVIPWMNRPSKGQQVATAFVISLIPTLSGVQVSDRMNAAWQLSAEQVQNATTMATDDALAPFSMDDMLLSAGAFFGLIGGAILLTPCGGFDARGSWARCLGRYVVGVVGVLITFSITNPTDSANGTNDRSRDSTGKRNADQRWLRTQMQSMRSSFICGNLRPDE